MADQDEGKGRRRFIRATGLAGLGAGALILGKQDSAKANHAHVAWQDEGIAKGTAGTVNVVGAGASVAVANGVATVTIPGGGGPPPTPPSHRRFVSSTGSDTTGNGSEGNPFRQIQKAYDDLGPNDNRDASGWIGVETGTYNPVTMDARKKATVEGLNGLPAFPIGFDEDQGAARIVSNGSPQLVLIQTPSGTVDNGFGFGFKNIAFQTSHAATLTGIFARACCPHVEHCVFAANQSLAAHDAAIFVKTDVDASHNDDASWVTMVDNFVLFAAICQLGQAPDSGGENSNRHVVSGNRAWGRGTGVTGARALIELTNCHGAYVAANNLEGAAVGERWNWCWGCTTIGNAGETVGVFWDGYGINGGIVAPTGESVFTAGHKYVRGDATNTVTNVQFFLPSVPNPYPDSAIDLPHRSQNYVVTGLSQSPANRP